MIIIIIENYNPFVVLLMLHSYVVRALGCIGFVGACALSLPVSCREICA